MSLRQRLVDYHKNGTPIIVNGIGEDEHCIATIKSIDDDCIVMQLLQDAKKKEDLKEEEVIVVINRISFISEGKKPYSGPIKNIPQTTLSPTPIESPNEPEENPEEGNEEETDEEEGNEECGEDCEND